MLMRHLPQCRQGNHCGSGMVFAINSDESSGRSFSAFQDLAKQLNGTAAGAAAPSPSSTSNGAGSHIPHLGGLATLLIGAVVAAFL